MTHGWTTVLVRYGEIGIKSPEVRRQFEKRLQENVESQLLARGVQGLVARERGRILVDTPQPDAALDALAHTFGVVSASPAEALPSGLDAMAKAVADRVRLAPGTRFAVRAKRSGAHGYTSMDVAREVGAAVMVAHASALKVDLTDPEVELNVEARADRAFLFTRSVHGPGGLPMGTQGRVVVLVEEPRSVHAAWLALRRGVSATLARWDVPDADVDAALRALAAWVPGLKVHAVAPPPGGPSRAAAMALARAAVRSRSAYAVVVGDALPDLAALGALDAACGRPVFRPLTGFPPARFRELAARDRLPAAAARAPPPGEAPPEGWAQEAWRTARVVEVAP